MGQKWRQENWNFLWKKKSSKLWINHPEKNDLKNGKPNLGFKKKKIQPDGNKKIGRLSEDDMDNLKNY